MAILPPALILARLRGTWRLEREYFGVSGSMNGTAAWQSGAADELHYAEEGILRVGARRLSATRRYDFRPVGDAVDIRFADGPNNGGLFLSLRFAETDDDAATAAASHLCAADLYEGEWRVGPAGLYSAITVTGPHKSYRMVSRYRR
jgi:hypothetical protein